MDIELQQYNNKSNLEKSNEPKGQSSASGKEGQCFVIQHHDATSLHYDFSIEVAGVEVAGVLKSWAVPKGPSTDFKVKRLAIAVEDHPVDYAGFEGIHS